MKVRAAIRLAFAGAVSTLMASTAMAEVVTLKSFDGFTQLRGELIEFDGSNYTIETGIGVIQVSALKVTCEGEACPEDPMFGAEFAIAGSNTVGAVLMPALIEGYAYSVEGQLVREIGNVENESTLRIASTDGREMAAIALRAHGSSTAFPALADLSAQIGMSSRRARDNDMNLLGAAGVPDLRVPATEQVVALDGLIAIVHPDNPLQTISIEDLALVFAGEISNWAELGGPDAEINLYARDDKSGTFDTFESLVLDEIGVSMSPLALRFQSNEELSDGVAQDPFGIGFTGLAFERGARALSIQAECGIVHAPSEFGVKTEEYPLSRRLYIYRRPGQMVAHAERLYAFALSEAAQPLIDDSGYVSNALDFQPIAAQGDRLVHAIVGEEEFSLPLMREMLSEVRGAQRLSLTFRFEPGSSALDAKAQADLGRFASLIQSGRFEGQELMLIGFTDSIGAFDLNRGLAVRRAQTVLQLLAQEVGGEGFGDQSVVALGYGELTPVGCNDSFNGRIANRRVEVWVRDPS